ncbi:MAG TPA: carboxypeptidase-like regulatory domain-containing protein [Acidobacteriaceae bacterium]|nr:carboxypeptidase-like regulatory domain-containing protein [Acidobacteriaceae bacterium]
MNLSRCLLAGAVAASFVFSGSNSWSQAVTATLVGTVSDSTGAVVPNATVKLTNQQTEAVATQATNSSGNYEFTFITPGTYLVDVTANGFKAARRTDVTVVVNTTTRVDMTLQAGSATQVVTVTGQAPLLQTDRADVTAQIDAVQVEDLPVGSQRNFQALESLVPGVSRPIYDHSSFFDAQNSQSFQVNGQSEESNNLQFEGIDDNERTGLLQVYIPPAEAIQTVDVETSNYSPEFGRSAGAVTNVTLKSGTNQFHGAAYEYNQVSALAARSYFNNTGAKQRTTNNYYGFTVGGPIVKNHTFFFGDFLRYSNHQNQFNLISVPTAAFRAGDLSAGPTNIYDPATGSSDGSGRTQFSYQGKANVIPPSRLAPIPQKILALVPLPNVAGAGFTNNYQKNTGFFNDTNTFDIKVNQQLRRQDSLIGRFSWQRGTTVQQPIFGAAGGPIASAFEGTGINTIWTPAVEYTHVFSPTLIAEFRGGIDHYRNIAQQSDYGKNDSTSLGVPGVNLDPYTSGLVGIDISGLSTPLVGYSPSVPWARAETNIDLVNNWTKIFGNHSIKAGFELRRVRDDLRQGQTFSPRGIFRYRDGETANKTGSSGTKTSFANDFASFLIDDPNQVGRDVNVNYASWRQTLYFAFVQDTWVATKSLTFTYGVRWELYPPATPERKGWFSQYIPATNSLHIAGYGNVPMNLGMQFNGTDFEPRVGLAWRAAAHTVVRTGFGISHTPFQDNNYAFNYPVRQNVAFNSNSSYTTALYTDGTPVTLAQGFPPPPVVPIPSTGIIDASTLPNQNWVYVNTKYRDPYVMSYNLTVEQQFGGWVADASYVGNQGREIPGNWNLNAGLVPGAGAAGQPYNKPPWKTTASIELLPKQLSSNYNSLQARLKHRFNKGLQIDSSFAWQKGMGFNSTGGGLGGFDFYIDPHRNYSLVSWNRKFTWAGSGIYELPFGKNRAYLQNGAGGWLLGGWEVGALSYIQSGTPLHFTASGNQLNAPGNTQVPDQVKPFQRLKGVGAHSNWFDPTAFVTPTGPVLGNVARYAWSGPGSVTFDGMLARSFPIHEQTSLKLRVDAFNAFNHPTFDNPSTDLTSNNYGHVTSGGGGRALQFSGTLRF